MPTLNGVRLYVLSTLRAALDDLQLFFSGARVKGGRKGCLGARFDAREGETKSKATRLRGDEGGVSCGNPSDFFGSVNEHDRLTVGLGASRGEIFKRCAIE